MVREVVKEEEARRVRRMRLFCTEFEELEEAVLEEMRCIRCG